MTAGPAADTQGGGGHGGPVNLNEPESTNEPDFDPWSDAHADRVLSRPQAYAVLRPVVKAMCQEMAVKGKIMCPFSLQGVAKLSRRLSKKAYQPVAYTCAFPTHPCCAQRSGELKMKCHRSSFETFQGLVAHASSGRRKVDEDDDGVDDELHQLLNHCLADVRPLRRWDTSDSVGGKWPLPP